MKLGVLFGLIVFVSLASAQSYSRYTPKEKEAQRRDSIREAEYESRTIDIEQNTIKVLLDEISIDMKESDMNIRLPKGYDVVSVKPYKSDKSKIGKTIQCGHEMWGDDWYGLKYCYENDTLAIISLTLSSSNIEPIIEEIDNLGFKHLGQETKNGDDYVFYEKLSFPIKHPTDINSIQKNATIGLWFVNYKSSASDLIRVFLFVQRE